LRGNFVVAVPFGRAAARPYNSLRAWSRLWRESFLQSHRFGSFLRDHQSSKGMFR
jgi:hypothetical protein